MTLENKRRIFFAIVIVLYFVLMGLVMFWPVMRWSDALTMQGKTIIGIPVTQFWVLFSGYGLAVLATIMFYGDTKVLAPKSDEDKKNVD